MVRFRRSAHVVSFWKDSRAYIQNFATGTSLSGSAALCVVADACSAWCSMTEIMERCHHLDPDAVRATVGRLTAHRILHRSDRPPPAEERAMSTFTPWNPAAGFFHTEAKKVRYRNELLFGPAPLPARRPPWPVKRYHGSTKVRLPDCVARGEFPDVVLARRSWRRFGTGPMQLDQAAMLLRLTAGMHEFAPTRAEGLIPLRTAPSAGARHPLEVYLLALRVTGLRRGFYHYGSDRHVLEVVRHGVKRGGVQRYLPTQYAFEHAAAIVFFSARFDRVIHRYPFTRAYRAAFVEAGHLCQTFCLTATWLGLAPFCSMALNDRHLETDLELDGVSESVLYCAGVGVPPADGRDGAAPPGVRSRRPIPNPVFQRP